MRKFLQNIASFFHSGTSQSKSAAVVKEPIPEEVLHEIREYIRREVAAGFEPEEGIASRATEVVEPGNNAEEIASFAVAATREMIAAHKHEQASWPEITDCDRLDAAFAELESNGVISRQNFSCCNTCGHTEIQGEMEQSAESGNCVRGYVFYHMQDTERAVDGGGVCLRFGAVHDDETAALKIAQEIAKAIKQHGLAANWDGTWEKCIEVSLDWKRRR